MTLVQQLVAKHLGAAMGIIRYVVSERLVLGQNLLAKNHGRAQLVSFIFQLGAVTPKSGQSRIEREILELGLSGNFEVEVIADVANGYEFGHEFLEPGFDIRMQRWFEPIRLHVEDVRLEGGGMDPQKPIEIRPPRQDARGAVPADIFEGHGRDELIVGVTTSTSAVASVVCIRVSGMCNGEAADQSDQEHDCLHICG